MQLPVVISQASTALGWFLTGVLYSSFRAEAEEQVKGFRGARHRKFDTREEAQEWLTAISSGQVSAQRQDSGNVWKTDLH